MSKPHQHLLPSWRERVYDLRLLRHRHTDTQRISDIEMGNYLSDAADVVMLMQLVMTANSGRHLRRAGRVHFPFVIVCNQYKYLVERCVDVVVVYTN
jgi:hypothetical protein